MGHPDPRNEDQDQLHCRFVGDIDLPESLLFSLVKPPKRLSVPYAGEEPLLKESKRRFVLFPIQYPEVRIPP